MGLLTKYCEVCGLELSKRQHLVRFGKHSDLQYEECRIHVNKGETYYFCSPDCTSELDGNPMKYMK